MHRRPIDVSSLCHDGYPYFSRATQWEPEIHTYIYIARFPFNLHQCSVSFSPEIQSVTNGISVLLLCDFSNNVGLIENNAMSSTPIENFAWSMRILRHAFRFAAQDIFEPNQRRSVRMYAVTAFWLFCCVCCATAAFDVTYENTIRFTSGALLFGSIQV